MVRRVAIPDGFGGFSGVAPAIGLVAAFDADSMPAAFVQLRNLETKCAADANDYDISRAISLGASGTRVGRIGYCRWRLGRPVGVNDAPGEGDAVFWADGGAETAFATGFRAAQPEGAPENRQSPGRSRKQ